MRLLDAIKRSKSEFIGAPDPELLTIPERESLPAKVIKLQGASWPQLGAVPLFVRWFYQPCIEGAMSNLDPDCNATIRRFIVLGNGGS